MSPLSLGILAERVDNFIKTIEDKYNDTRSDLNAKHLQNRKDIHEIRNELQKLNNQIWLLKLKIAGYAGIGSSVGVGVLEFFKWLFTMHK